MIQVQRLRVLSLSVDFNQVSWDIGDTSEDIYDYTFQVFRSEAYAGPFEPASVEMQDQFMFIDNLIKVGDIYRQYHYKVRTRNKQTNQVVDFGPIEKSPEPTLIAQELRVHMNLLMREFIGRRCWVLPVRTFGQRCADCWNPRLQQRRYSGCRTCFDTSFVRGYYLPVETWMSIDPTAKAEQPSSFGKQQSQSTTAKMSCIPPMKPNDLIVEPENIRWVVRTVTTTQEQRSTITQDLTLHRIPSTDIEYSLPLDLGVPMESLYFTPSRNYTNPFNFDDKGLEDIDYPGIFQLYPNYYPPVTK